MTVASGSVIGPLPLSSHSGRTLRYREAGSNVLAFMVTVLPENQLFTDAVLMLQALARPACDPPRFLASAIASRSMSVLIR